jgi:hypothetical protein
MFDHEYDYDNTEPLDPDNLREYRMVPTLRLFHECGSQVRAVVGPVGSGKTSAATLETSIYLPLFVFNTHGIKKTRWVVVRNCFSADTEILTENGWKFFPDLGPTEKVAQLNDDDELEFVLPTYHYQADYVGQMIGYEGEGVDFLVTPDHRLSVSMRNARKKEWSPYRFRKAAECYGKQNMKVKRDAKWTGVDPGYSEDMFEWLGFWFAEGSAAVYDYRSKGCGGWRCVITQKKGLDYVRDLFQRADIPYGEHKRGDCAVNFNVSIGPQTKPLILKLCDCGKSTTKRVPAWIKNAPTGHLLAFLKGYEAGDGGHATTGVRTLLTSSKGLADDFQEIALRAGLAANVHKTKEAGVAYCINGVEGATSAPSYSVTLTSFKTEPRLIAQSHKGKYRGWYKEQYAGKVYCVEVPSHRVYVRRCGKSLWNSQTYSELMDTTLKTMFEWVPNGRWKASDRTYTLKFAESPIEVEILFRSCDRPEDVKKFKSLEVTGYWIDEANEVDEEIKRMLKNRIGRFPKKSPVRFGIETSNPPDTDHAMYHQFKWVTPVPGPMPDKEPLKNHTGFWQPPRENVKNLRVGYYEDLLEDYRDEPEWIAVYIEGKPGILTKGKLIYNNFKREHHMAFEPLIWVPELTIYRGWDNSGNIPACVLGQVPSAQRMHVLKEFYSEKKGIGDFTRWVVEECNKLYPGAKYIDYGDPAGANKFSKKEGGFTSNAQIMLDEGGVSVISAEQNLTARTQAVDAMLARRDGVLLDPSCKKLINGFIGGYHFPLIHSALHGNYYGDKPVKNKFSHIHDAFQYLMVSLFRSAGTGMAGKFTPRRSHRFKRGRG